jgi:hypothetical protein
MQIKETKKHWLLRSPQSVAFFSFNYLLFHKNVRKQGKAASKERERGAIIIYVTSVLLEYS